MRTHRDGFSLIEMLVVMVGLTMVIGLSVVALAGLMQTERAERRNAVEVAQRAALAAMFRADVHAATSHEAAPLPFGPGLEQLTLTLPGGRIVTYRLQPDRIVRSQHDDGTETTKIETFRLRKQSQPRLDLVTFEGATLARLVPASGDGQEDTALCIEAVLGRDGRFKSKKEATP